MPLDAAQHLRSLLHRWPAAWPAPPVAALSCLAMFSGGVAIGAASYADHGPPAGPRRVIAIAQAPAAVPATPAAPAAPAAPTETATPDDGVAAGGDAAAASVDDGASEATVDDTVPQTGDTTTPADPTDDGTDGEDPGTDGDPPTASPLPPVKHVWLITLTGQRYEETWGPAATEPYLKELLTKGTVLPNSFAVAHGALPNGIALLSGQGPNPQTQAGCGTVTALAPGTIAAADKDPLQQAAGAGCLYPATVPTLLDQLTGGGLTWKAYVESIASPDPAQPQTCRHGEVGAPDPFAVPRPGDPYLTPRNPFVYFAAITGDAVCGSNVVGLDRLAPDLATTDQIPTFSYIVPNTCHDGSTLPCAEGAPAGLPAAAPWLKGVVDQITATKAYTDGGLIVVTTDHAPAEGPLADARACACDAGTATAPFWPNTPDAGVPAPTPVTPSTPRGGGRVGTLLLSPFVTPGRSVPQSYDHASILKSIEDLFGLPHLGVANDPAHKPLGPKVYSKYTPVAASR